MSLGDPPGTWSGNLHASQINVNNAYRAAIARFFGSSEAFANPSNNAMQDGE